MFTSLYKISTDSSMVVFMTNAPANTTHTNRLKLVSVFCDIVKVAHQFQCTTIDYFDSCLCNFYRLAQKTNDEKKTMKKKKEGSNPLIYSSTIDFKLYSFHGYFKLHFTCSRVIYCNIHKHFHCQFASNEHDHFFHLNGKILNIRWHFLNCHMPCLWHLTCAHVR